jgi:hypothetical protein
MSGDKKKLKTAARPRDRKRGRPSLFSAKLAEAICARLADGEMLRKICEDEAMPSKRTVMRWLAQDAEFQNQYSVAKVLQADELAEQGLEIADDLKGDAQRARVQIEYRKWIVGKIAPRKYGERISQEISGPGGAPVSVRAAAVTVRMPAPEVAKRVAALLQRAAKELGLAATKGKPQALAQQILATGQALPPEIYEALFLAKGQSDD